MADCNKCAHVECDSRSDSVSVCLSFRGSVDAPEDLVPTMKLRFKITAASNKGNIESPVTLQQWWLDRNVINSDGTAGGGRWVDIPVEVE